MIHLWDQERLEFQQKKHNCNYIGSEISSNYCEIATHRINNTKILNSNNFF